MLLFDFTCHYLANDISKQLPEGTSIEEEADMEEYHILQRSSQIS